jgi:hypothetical protein
MARNLLSGIVATLVLSSCPSAFAAEQVLPDWAADPIVTLEGRSPELKYGNVVAFGAIEVQLYGIVAPQTLTDPKVRNALMSARTKVQGNTLTCKLSGAVIRALPAGTQRFIGICFNGLDDIAEDLVRDGVARDCPRLSRALYTAIEQEGLAERPQKTPAFQLPVGCRD